MEYVDKDVVIIIIIIIIIIINIIIIIIIIIFFFFFLFFFCFFFSVHFVGCILCVTLFVPQTIPVVTDGKIVNPEYRHWCSVEGYVETSIFRA